MHAAVTRKKTIPPGTGIRRHVDVRPGHYQIRPRDLHLLTALVRDGHPAAVIAIPDTPPHREAARIINDAVERQTGIRLPVVPDRQYRFVRRLETSLILPGNYTNNLAINQLYRMHYTLLDPQYPGRNGSVVRTLHNPFGDGHNVVFAGASDENGLARAAAQLAARIAELSTEKDLTLGRLADIRLGDGLTPPENATRHTPLWATATRYPDSGFFGNNILSKNMMMYYMTGDEKYAREFMRLAFPTPEVAEEIRKIDDERIHDPRDPLVYPYHYTAIGMILYWDLIEESPFFSEDDRLRITQKFQDQLEAWRDQPDNAGVFRNNRQPRYTCTDRHENWELMAVYGLCRYFTKYYPDNQTARDGARFTANAFDSWNKGTGHEAGTLGSHVTEMDPVFLYAALTGDPAFLGSPAMKAHARSILTLTSGRYNDWATASASLTMLRRAACLTGDQALVEAAERIPLDQNIFRGGQSYWTTRPYEFNTYRDLAGQWQFYRPDRIDDKNWNVPFDKRRVCEWLSFRSEQGDDHGDFLLIDTKYEWGRNAFHNFNAVSLILNGTPLLNGYHNQLHLYRDGLAGTAAAKYSRPDRWVKLGDTAAIRATVPDFSGHDWTRTWLLREGRYAIAFDRVVPQTDRTATLARDYFEVNQAVTPRQYGANILLQHSRMPAPAEAVLYRRWPDLRNDFVNGPRLSAQESSDVLLITGLKPGDRAVLEFTLPRAAVNGRLLLEMLNAPDRGSVRVLLDDQVIVPVFRHESETVAPAIVPTEQLDLAAGKHALTFEMLSTPRGDQSATLGLRALAVTEGDCAPPRLYTVACSYPAPISFECVSVSFLPTDSAGSAFHFAVTAETSRNAPLYFASVIRPGAPSGTASDAAGSGDAATFRLPAPAFARQTGEGLMLAEEDHLFVLNLAEAASLFRATAPVSFDWNLATGKLCAVADRDTELNLDGRTIPVTATAAERILLPSPAFLAHIRRTVREQSTALFAARATGGKAQQTAPVPAPELLPTWRNDQCPELVSELVPCEQEDTVLTVAAQGRRIRIFTESGPPVREWETPAPVGALCWWPEEKLLLAGCLDEKVCAFSTSGELRWTYISRMSEGLATAPNWYWHKSAIPGISGIRTSPWRPGENCAFIGSTGTLEMLDRDGRLLRSYCQNWGAVNSFAFHTAPDGLRELFTGRAFCGAARVYRINNRDRDANISGFAELPAQDNVHHYGWEMLGRTHLFVRDLDGSGVPRLIGDVNGVFNLVAVWDLAGNPLYGVALGEGRKPPRFDRNSYGKFMLTPHHVRGMAVENITGVANRQEIILAHAGKTLVVFDHLLRKIWSAPLPADPVSLGVRPASGVTPGRILVGCEDGSLLCFSGEGRLLGQTRLLGAVTRIALCKDGFAAGSATGTIAFFPFF